jgi:hypothetical protein
MNTTDTTTGFVQWSRSNITLTSPEVRLMPPGSTVIVPAGSARSKIDCRTIPNLDRESHNWYEGKPVDNVEYWSLTPVVTGMWRTR